MITLDHVTKQYKASTRPALDNVSLKVDKGPAAPQDVVLEIRGLTVRSDTGQAMVDNIDLDVRSGEVVRTIAGDGLRDLAATTELAGLEAGEYVYVRLVQTDGGAAWSSPIFVD